MAEYAVYRGDELLVMGTREECAERMGVAAETIAWMVTPTAKKRLAGRKKPHKCLVVDRLED